MDNPATNQELQNKIGLDQAKKQSRAQNGSGEISRAKWLNKRLLSVPVTLEITATAVPEPPAGSEEEASRDKRAGPQDQTPTAPPDSKEQGFQPGGGQAPGQKSKPGAGRPLAEEAKETGERGQEEKSAGKSTGQPSGAEWQNATQKARAAKGAKASALTGGGGETAGGAAKVAGVVEKGATANPVMRVILWVILGNKKFLLNEPMTPVEKYGTILLDLLIVLALLIIGVLFIILFSGPCVKTGVVSYFFGWEGLAEGMLKLCL